MPPITMRNRDDHHLTVRITENEPASPRCTSSGDSVSVQHYDGDYCLGETTWSIWDLDRRIFDLMHRGYRHLDAEIGPDLEDITSYIFKGA